MNYKHFSIEEREIIQTMRWEKKGVRAIARTLKRSPSSVSREIQRNNPPKYQVYTPRLAHERALKSRKSRGRKDRLKNERIRSYVITHLKQRLSPEQIAGRIKKDLKESISHEAIYQFIYDQVYREGRGLLKPGREDLRMHLRRRKKRRSPKGMRRSQRVLKERGTSIDKRPRVVDARKRIGDWEGDSIESKDHKPGLNTLVERKTGLVFITRLRAKTSAATLDAIEQRMKGLHPLLLRTLTLDNGPENQSFEEIHERLGLDVFYAHPYCSGERGTNENTNGLIRDYFPKKTDFDMITDEEIARVELALNSRPRKRLQYQTPLEAMSVALGG